VTTLTSSAGHVLSSPLNWCRGKNLSIAGRELQQVGLRSRERNESLWHADRSAHPEKW